MPENSEKGDHKNNMLINHLEHFELLYSRVYLETVVLQILKLFLSVISRSEMQNIP